MRTTIYETWGKCGNTCERLGEHRTQNRAVRQAERELWSAGISKTAVYRVDLLDGTRTLRAIRPSAPDQEPQPLTVAVEF